MANMMKQAQRMQQQMLQMQQDLEEKEYQATAGGGVVTAVLTGKGFGWNEYLVLALTMATNFITEYLYDRFFVFGKSLDTAAK